MERRQALGHISALAALSLAATSASAQAPKQPAKAAAPAAGHHHHHGSAKAEALIESVTDCINKGEACLAHCLVLLGEGDKSVAGCARSVNETLAVCEALRKLAAQGSSRAPALARVAMNACLDCEKECRKHEKKHAECANCAKACADCAKECKAFAA